MTKIVNLTKHDIVVRINDTDITFPSAGEACVETIEVVVGYTNDIPRIQVE